MKKILSLLVIVAFALSIGGCATLCKNKDAIMAGIQTVITTAQAVSNEAQAVVNDIHTKYPNMPIPTEIQAVLDKANKVIGQAQAIYDEAQMVAQIVCPMQAQLDTLNQELKNAQANMAATQSQYTMAKVGMKK